MMAIWYPCANLATTFLNPSHFRNQQTYTEEKYFCYDSDVLHAGMLNSVGLKRVVTQYKVKHVSDITKLSLLTFLAGGLKI
jgi:hypothetical protein